MKFWAKMLNANTSTTRTIQGLAFCLLVCAMVRITLQIGKKQGSDCQLAQDLADIANVSSTLGSATTTICMGAMKHELVANTPIIRIFCAEFYNHSPSPLRLAQKRCSNAGVLEYPWLYAAFLFCTAVVSYVLYLSVGMARRERRQDLFGLSQMGLHSEETASIQSSMT